MSDTAEAQTDIPIEERRHLVRAHWRDLRAGRGNRIAHVLGLQDLLTQPAYDRLMARLAHPEPEELGDEFLDELLGTHYQEPKAGRDEPKRRQKVEGDVGHNDNRDDHLSHPIGWLRVIFVGTFYLVGWIIGIPAIAIAFTGVGIVGTFVWFQCQTAAIRARREFWYGTGRFPNAVPRLRACPTIPTTNSR